MTSLIPISGCIEQRAVTADTSQRRRDETTASRTDYYFNSNNSIKIPLDIEGGSALLTVRVRIRISVPSNLRRPLPLYVCRVSRRAASCWSPREHRNRMTGISQYGITLLLDT